MRMRIEDIDCDSDGTFELPDDARIYRIDWYHPDDTERRVPSRVWIARPVDG